MNKQRRTSLARALPLIEQAAALLAQAQKQIADVHGEEEEAYDNLSDGQRNGDLGSDMDQCISDLRDAMDAIDTIDLAAIATGVATIANAAEPEIGGPKLTDNELQARRLERLAPWARDMINRAERRAKDADDRLAEAFTDRDLKNSRQIIVDDYDSPVRGKVIPSEQVTFPGLGIRVSASRVGNYLEISGIEMGGLTVRAQASNTLHVRLDRNW